MTDKIDLRRGWSSAGLKTVGDDPGLWTATDAARLLGPPMLNPAQVRQLIRMFDLAPAGKRRTTEPGKAGRHARVYLAIDLIKAYHAIAKLT